MNPKEMKKFSGEILNDCNFRSLRNVLREKVKQIDRLESLDSLRDLKLTSMQMDEDSPICLISYSGLAESEIYPHLRSNLIKTGIVSKNNVLRSYVGNKGKPDEYEQLTFGVSGNSIQVTLRAYNPGWVQ